MKKIIFIYTVLILSFAASAQNYNVWEHNNYDGNTHQCYDIIELSDGNFMVDEDVFSDYGDDTGIILYKITPEGIAVDSAFISAEMLNINSGFPKLRDPFNDNSNIFTSFYNEDGAAHYKALYINDNLEITGEVVAELDIDGTIGSDFRAFINHNNDIVIHDIDGNGSERFYIIGLDGTTKFVSQPVEKKYYMLAQRPFFMINKSPVCYGFITCRRTSSGDWVYIEVYDEEFNRIEEHKINTAGQYTYVSYYAHMCGSYLDEGHFLLTAPASDQYNNHFNVLVKFDNDFQVVEKFTFGDSSYDYLMKKNIAATDDGRIYVVWVDQVGSYERNLIIDCLDFDLNLQDEARCLSILHIVNSGLAVSSNGGLALCGWGYKSDAYYYESSYIYAVVFNEYFSTSEIADSTKPFLCYTNPAKDVLNISFTDDSECQSVAIYSIDGRLVVETFPETSQSSTINIANLTPGLYLIKVSMSDGKEFTERIVKE